MEKKESQLRTPQRKALRQNKAAKETELATASPPPDRNPLHIYKNERGELAISRVGSVRVTQTFLGTNSADQDNTTLDNHRWAQLCYALPQSKGKCDDPQMLNIALDGVAALQPRDGMEVMLCSQLVALHSQGLQFLGRGMLPEQTTDGVDRNVNRAAKLLRSFATIAECLRTYRGGGHQKVTVEHVTVQAGGQAIVGTVNKGVGGGDAQQNSK